MRNLLSCIAFAFLRKATHFKALYLVTMVILLSRIKIIKYMRLIILTAIFPLIKIKRVFSNI
jgi:hypothetical protein